MHVPRPLDLGAVEELEPIVSMKQIKAFRMEPKSFLASWRQETQERSEGCRRSCSQNISSSERSDWENWPLGSFGMFAEGGSHTSQFLPSLSTAFLEQNRDRTGCAFWSLP